VRCSCLQLKLYCSYYPVCDVCVCVWMALVRQKVRELVALIQDDDSLRTERKKAKKNKDKYIGMSGGLSGQHYC